MPIYSFTHVLTTTTTFDALGIRGLATARAQLVSPPGSDRCLMVKDVVIRKSGAHGVPDSHRIPHLALACVSDGGALRQIGNGESVQQRGVLQRPLYMLAEPGQHSRHLLPGMLYQTSGQDYGLFVDVPLMVCAVYAGDQWADAMDGISDLRMEFVVRYEIMQIDG